MTINELRNIIKHLPGRTELLFLPKTEIDVNDMAGPGLAYLDIETEELMYIGDLEVIEDIDEN